MHHTLTQAVCQRRKIQGDVLKAQSPKLTWPLSSDRFWSCNRNSVLYVSQLSYLNWTCILKTHLIYFFSSFNFAAITNWTIFSVGLGLPNARPRYQEKIFDFIWFCKETFISVCLRWCTMFLQKVCLIECPLIFCRNGEGSGEKVSNVQQPKRDGCSA